MSTTKIEKKIVLIDGRHLAELMIDHGVGVSPLATYTIHRVDEDFFEGELSGAPDPISLAEVAS